MKEREPAGKAEVVRRNAILTRDADLLEASLGKLPQPSKRPAVVVMAGLPGSGKSHLARLIAARIGTVQLDSDALRKALYREPKHTEKEHRRLFPALHVLMDRLLARGLSLVVDATNLKEANRKPYYKVAEKHRAPVVLVRTWAPPGVIRQRLADRESKRPAHDHSTATLAVYEKMRPGVEPLRKKHVSVDTSRQVKPAVDRIALLLQS